MDNLIAAYILDRIRQPLPAGCHVVSGSTPVLAFGNFRQARVATVGLNPSQREFLDKHSVELTGPRRRLATLASLGVPDLATANEATSQQLIADCDAYFHLQPYWSWFRPLEELLDALGASYRAGSACHLDLVQWATAPVWGQLPPHARGALLNTDTPFLRQQLEREQITTVLLNGRGVVDAFAVRFGISLTPQSAIIADRKVATQLVVGHAFGGRTIIGWSTNLQSSFGVTREFRRRLAHAVAQVTARSGLA